MIERERQGYTVSWVSCHHGNIPLLSAALISGSSIGSYSNSASRLKSSVE